MQNTRESQAPTKNEQIKEVISRFFDYHTIDDVAENQNFMAQALILKNDQDGQATRSCISSCLFTNTQIIILLSKLQKLVLIDTEVES